MAYLTFDEYKAYGGTLDETAFNNFEYEAALLVDWYTFNRLKGEEEYGEEVKRCVFKLMGIMVLKAQALTLGQSVDNVESSATTNTSVIGSAVASQSNDGVSISYNVITASEMLEQSKKQIEECINLYLSAAYNSRGLKLTYRGMYPGEEIVKRI